MQQFSGRASAKTLKFMPTPVAPSPSYVGALGEQTTLPAIIDLRAEATPDDCFATLGGRSLTFAQALQRAESAAGALASLGVRKGDKVAIMLPNSLEFIDLWFASALLGAVIVPVNTQLRGEGLRYIVDHCDADVCVVDAQLVEQYEFAVPAGAGPSQRFVRGREAPTSWTPVEDLLSGDHSPAPRAKVEPEDLASVLYTSGTTGLPKGVMTCHNAYAATGFEYAQRYVRLRADDVLYTCLPLFHSNAQAITTVPALLSGRPMVMTSRFSASGFLDEMRSHGATVFNYIGAMLTILLKQPERPDDADNPIRLTVGSSAPREQWTEFERRFGIQIVEIYGLTETAGVCLASPPDDVRVGKCGVPVSWSEVQIHNDEATEADPDEPGEFVIRSRRPNVMFRGYYKDPDATAKAMARRLVPFGRPRPALAGRVLRVHRPVEGLDPPARREHLLVRGRAGGQLPSGCGRERCGGSAVGAGRGGRHDRRRATRCRRGRPRRARGVLRRAHGCVHGAALCEGR